MADAQGRVGIILTAKDKTSKAFKSATANVGKLKEPIKALPDAAGKAAGAMLLLQNSTSQMGGRMADAVNKIGAVVALIATGGPLGLALAGVTAAVAAVTFVIDGLDAPTRAAKEGFESMAKAVSLYSQETDAAKAATEGLGDSLLAIGRSQIDAKLIDLRFELIDTTKSLKELMTVGTSSEVLAAGIERVRALKEQIQRTEELKKATADQAKTDKARSDAKSAADDRDREADEARKARLASWVTANKEWFDEQQRLSNAQLDRETEALNARLSRIDQLSAARQAQIDFETDLQIASDMRMAESRMQSAQDAADVISAISGSIMESSLSNDEEVRKKTIASAVDTAFAVITTKAASGAAKAFEAYAGIPVVGPALGAVAAGVVSAAILAFRGAIKLNQGGLVTGGTPGKDSVPALLAPGERVLSKAQNERGGFGGGDINVSLTMPTTIPANDTELTRAARIIGEKIEEMRARGMLRGAV